MIVLEPCSLTLTAGQLHDETLQSWPATLITRVAGRIFLQPLVSDKKSHVFGRERQVSSFTVSLDVLKQDRTDVPNDLCSEQVVRPIMPALKPILCQRILEIFPST